MDVVRAADLAVRDYPLHKTPDTAALVTTSAALHLALTAPHRLADSAHPQNAAVAAARAACQQARVLHWPLAFAQVFAAGGFDCVLGNPPWERIKLQEEEFFATRHPAVANASNKAERSRYIEALRLGTLAQQLASSAGHPLLGSESEAEQRLYAEFISTRRTAEASSVFLHVDGGEGGRYPLTGVGDVNTYALFAETILHITAPTGRAGFIVPPALPPTTAPRPTLATSRKAGGWSACTTLKTAPSCLPPWTAAGSSVSSRWARLRRQSLSALPSKSPNWPTRAAASPSRPTSSASSNPTR